MRPTEGAECTQHGQTDLPDNDAYVMSICKPNASRIDSMHERPLGTGTLVLGPESGCGDSLAHAERRSIYLFMNDHLVVHAKAMLP